MYRLESQSLVVFSGSLGKATVNQQPGQGVAVLEILVHPGCFRPARARAVQALLKRWSMAFSESTLLEANTGSSVHVLLKFA